ncbi:MAG: AMP-binding protein [Parachlamydiales bacterium]|nr:AMP-binding protein [Parachlamydiales bacterium]
MRFWSQFLSLGASCLLKLRYRITFTGLDDLKQRGWGKNSRIIFMPNHPCQMDVVILLSKLLPLFAPRPLVVDYLYENPFVRWFLGKVDGIPIPNFDSAANSLCRKRADRAFEKVGEVLDNGNNLLIYPAGRLQLSGEEVIGGASGIERLLKDVPDVNIVLIRFTGLWGSSFSRALTGQVPDLGSQLKEGFRILCRNLIFFAPRRDVHVHLEVASDSFPRTGTRIEINRSLENWYNAPYDGGVQPMKLVPYKFWSKKLPTVLTPKKAEGHIDLDSIPKEIQDEVIEELAKITRRNKDDIKMTSDLSRDLGMDSLELAELFVYMSDHFGIQESVDPLSISNVQEVMALAAGQLHSEVKDEEFDMSHWMDQRPHPFKAIPDGDTIDEVFLRTCDLMKNHVAAADELTGALTYARLKQASILLAEQIKKLPGQQIGILMPSTVAASIFILGCLLAGKTPVPINWTMGSRYLKEVIHATELKSILSSWRFLEKVSTIDLEPIEEKIVCIEDIRKNIGLKDMLSAVWISKKSTESILNYFNRAHATAHSIAVILFTSGTEGKPKGVPLSHDNILSNQRASFKVSQIQKDDILLSFLPPFHSFGFTITILLPILAGVRAVFYPDPTDSSRLAKAIEKWKVTLVCGSPTFVKNILRAGSPEQLRSVRMFVTGAEKAPKSLYEEVKSMNKELIEGYGSTECSPIVTFNRPGQPHNGVGQPIHYVDLAIYDMEKEVLLKNPKEEGLILVKGPNIFNGYWQDDLSPPFLTVDGEKWYNTGDIGYVDENNNLYLEGRLKRFVKVGGEMINLALLEDILKEEIKTKKIVDAESNQAAVAVIAQEKEGEKPRLYLFTSVQMDTKSANSILKESGLSNLAKLYGVIKVAEIPQLATGKIDYQKLNQELPKT